MNNDIFDVLKSEHRKFAEEYVRNGENATEAYMNVYKCKKRETARVSANRLLQNVNIKKYIDFLRGPKTKSTIADIDEIKEFFTSVMRDKEENVKDRLRAGENLCKMYGAFVDRKDIKMDAMPVIISGENKLE